MVWAPPIGGRTEAPGFSLGIEVVEIGEAAGREEGVAHIADGAFDTALLVAAGDRHGPRLVTILSGKAQQCGMEADGLAASFQHRTFEIVVQ